MIFNLKYSFLLILMRILHMEKDKLQDFTMPYTYPHVLQVDDDIEQLGREAEESGGIALDTGCRHRLLGHTAEPLFANDLEILPLHGTKTSSTKSRHTHTHMCTHLDSFNKGYFKRILSVNVPQFGQLI